MGKRDRGKFSDGTPRKWYHNPDLTFVKSVRMSVFASALIVGVLAGTTAIVLTVRGIDRHMTIESCSHYGAATGVPAKFVQLNWWDYDCYVKFDGRWVPRGNVNGYITSPGKSR